MVIAMQALERACQNQGLTVLFVINQISGRQQILRPKFGFTFT
jgi:hypothetical protein